MLLYHGTHYFLVFCLLTYFTGVTNQAIVQRSLGAKNLAEGQKGVLAAAVMKVFGVAMLVSPWDHRLAYAPARYDFCAS